MLPLKAGIVVLDAAREQPFAKSGQPLAGGFALVEPDPRIFTAFNAAPGTVAPEAGKSYSPYAQALAEMIRTGGLTLPEVFDRVRLRVNDVTKGAQVPWDTRKVDASVMFFERAPDAPQPATNAAVSETSKPISAYDSNAAYTAALARDTLPDYDAFVAAYPSDPLAKRVRAIIAARREAITWRRSYVVNTPESYWSYLRRYPRGPHAFDARRRLAVLTAPIEPPPTFATIAYDVPPPPPEEIVYVERPVLIFSDPDYAFAPPPPPPIYFLPPPPPDFIVLEPPPPVFALFILPRPRFVPIPVYVVAPRYVVPPVNNPVFTHIHNAPAINNAVNRPPPALPPSVAQRASLIQQGKLQPPAGVMSRGPGAPATGPAPARLGAPLPRAGRIAPAARGSKPRGFVAAARRRQSRQQPATRRTAASGGAPACRNASRPATGPSGADPAARRQASKSALGSVLCTGRAAAAPGHAAAPTADPAAAADAGDGPPGRSSSHGSAAADDDEARRSATARRRTPAETLGAAGKPCESATTRI